jgi:ABC-type Fe3+-hydroxamate transport system substrate-binding protein
MSLFTDQAGRKITMSSPPKRIISLVPSQTELLSDLGLDAEVCGITKFCIHPHQWFRNKTRIGGTKQIDLQKIKSLSPDLIIANKEENVREQVEALAENYPVWVSDVNTLEDATGMISGIAEICDRKKEGEKISNDILLAFRKIKVPAIRLKTVYLIWKDPYMTVGSDTFIHDMMNKAGFENAFRSFTRYPQVTVDQLKEAGCELLLLSSEPYPFREKHINELQSQLRNTRIILVDGEMFSWYGSRLLKVPAYFEELRHRIGVIS